MPCDRVVNRPCALLRYWMEANAPPCLWLPPSAMRRLNIVGDGIQQHVYAAWPKSVCRGSPIGRML